MTARFPTAGTFHPGSGARPLLVLFALTALPPLVGAADAARGDFWLDAELSFRLAGQPATPAPARRKAAAPSAAITSDYAKKIAGDCSVRADLRAGAALQLLPTGARPWALGREWTLELQLATDSAPPPRDLNGVLALVDAQDRRAEITAGPVAGPATGWTAFAFPLAAARAPAGCDFTRIKHAELAFPGRPPATVWLDAVRFTAPGAREIALTDVTTAQRIADEQASRRARLDEAFPTMLAGGAAEKNSTQAQMTRHFANLWLDRDVAATNRALLAIYTATDPAVRAHHNLDESWDLFATPMLLRLYFNFGHASKRHPGRLAPDTERALLELLWQRTQFKNDILAARQSTWELSGSENHDLNARIANLLTSQIFAQHPDFASRVYPNRGTGFGFGYWFHSTDATGRFHGPEGTAPKPTSTAALGPREHYPAWLAFMKKYLRERAGRGFFLEKASPGYMRHSLSWLQDLHDFAADDELRRLTGMFLDLVWAEWAQDEIGGARGGAKTRDHGPLVDARQDAMYQMASFLFGGPARSNPTLTSFWLTDYRPPPVVWNLALNRAALGSFAYVSRTPGEEPAVAPRPAGLERALWCDTDARLVRYSWVTPDFVLGTQMDHPLAIHSHLSVVGRAQGMLFGTSPRAMVFPRAISVPSSGAWKLDAEAMYRSVQRGPVLITQQSRAFLAVSPEWFPRQIFDSKPFGVYFSPGLGRVEEEGGWVFVEEGDAYLAVRPVRGVYQASVDAGTGDKEWVGYQGAAALEEPLAPRPYTWSDDRTLLRFDDRHSPVVFEAGRRAEHATLDEFKRRILGNRLVLEKTVVPGWYRLTYVSRGTTYYFNAANNEIPRVNGEPITYAPARVFDSPWLSSDFRSGVVTVTDGRSRLILDFGRAERRELPASPHALP